MNGANLRSVGAPVIVREPLRGSKEWRDVRVRHVSDLAGSDAPFGEDE
jgi:hypothetical protein